MVDGMPRDNGVVQFRPDQSLPADFKASPWFASLRGVTAGAVADGMSRTIVLAETQEKGYSSWIDGTTCWVVAYDPSLNPPFCRDGKWQRSEKDSALLKQTSLSIAPSVSPPVRYLASKVFNERIKSGMAYGPSSSHSSDGVMHAFGDSSTSLIASDVDPSVYISLCSRNGQESLDPDSFEKFE